MRELKNYVRRMCIFGVQSGMDEFSQQVDRLRRKGIKQKVILKDLLAQVKKNILW